MRFGAILGTKDELDVLPQNIEHLRRIGVSVIVIQDYGSTDGTLEYLAAAEAEGDIWVQHPTIHDPYDVWERIKAKLSRSLMVDWVLFLDSDEFWLPASGSLHDVADLNDGDVLTVPRYNVVLGPDGLMMPRDPSRASYDEVFLYARSVGSWYERMTQDPEGAWIRGMLEPKILARPEAIGQVLSGDHAVSLRAGGPWRSVIASDVLIAHAPFRTFERFERRSIAYRKAIDAFPEWYAEKQGWQWVRWARLQEKGTLSEEFERQRLSRSELEGLRTDGTVRSVAAMFERLIPAMQSEKEYDAAVRHAQPWVSAAGIVCKRESIAADMRLNAASTGLYPTVVVPPDHVVKLYGSWRGGHQTRRAELGALRILSRDPDLPAPRLVGSGSLDEEWEYVVETLVPGTAFAEAREGLAAEEGLKVASWLGRFIRRLHAVPVAPESGSDGAVRFDGKIGERRSKVARIYRDGNLLPAHLAAELDDWLPPAEALVIPEEGAVLLHADLHDEHLLGRLVEGRFHPTGVIDFNRAHIGHPLYELGPIWRWFFLGDGELMAAFLAEARLPGHDLPDFPRLALAWCLLHEGVAQYVVDIPGIETTTTLDELAARSFRPSLLTKLPASSASP